MTNLVEGFEGGADGATLTTGNTNLNAFSFAGVFATNPSGSGKVAKLATGQIRDCRWTTAVGVPVLTGVHYMRVYIYLTGAGVDYCRILSFRDEQGAFISNGWNMWNGATRGMRLVSLSTNTGIDYELNTGTWYRLEVKADYDNKTVEGKVFLGHNTSPLTTQSVSWTTIARTNVNGQIDAAMFGNANSLQPDMYFDDFAYSTDGWIGPSVTTQPGQLDATIHVGV